MNAAPLLRIENVACIRGGRLLFEQISLTLVAGGGAMITGANGVGKSSLIRIAAGLLKPAEGKVEASPAALADEAPALDERQTLGAALSFWARMDGGRTEAGLEAMGLTRISAVPVRMLSTGQRKRATLARVIASGAPLWLLDEPLNGLDVEGQERLGAAIAAHRAGRGAVLAASHQPLALVDAEELRLEGA